MLCAVLDRNLRGNRDEGLQVVICIAANKSCCIAKRYVQGHLDGKYVSKRQVIFKHLIIAAMVLTFQSLTTFGQECKKLDDGQYYFKYKTKGYEKADFMLTIKGGRYFITKSGQEYPKGIIEWWADNCMFKLASDRNQVIEKTDSLNIFQKTFLSYGGYCYELTGKWKFRLTYCGNLPITSGEGRIVKK